MSAKHLACLSLLLAACVVGTIDDVPIADGDAAPEPEPTAPPPGSGDPALVTFSKVAITSLSGASPNAGAVGPYVSKPFPAGTAAGPSLSNTVLSAVPGTPPKPLFVGQNEPVDVVLIGVEGQFGYFAVPAGGNSLVAIDLITSPAAASGSVRVLVATRTGTTISAPTKLTLVVDPRIFVAAGDLFLHDTDDQNIADLFGSVLEGKQSAAQPVAGQVLEGENNNDLVQEDGIKGPLGPSATGHREVVWDGVPEGLRNADDFSETFFDRQPDGLVGLRGGIVFEPVDGTGLEVNDALDGTVPNPLLVGPPTNDNAELGGDFSNHSLRFAGNLLSFTQSAQFATLGTVITDVTFHVAGSDTPGVVGGMGVVFSSVDKENVTYVEYFDENGLSIAKVFAPVKSQGPFPVAGPLGTDAFSYSFVGYVDPNARIARVRIVAGEAPIDLAVDDIPAAAEDVVVFDDIYYGEPTP